MYRNYCILVAILSLAYGLGYTLIPSVIANYYFEAPSDQVSAMGRYFGLSLLGSGIMVWLLKDIIDIPARKAVLTGTLVSSVVGLLTSVFLVLNGTMQPFGWSAAVIYLVFVIWAFLTLKTGNQMSAE